MSRKAALHSTSKFTTPALLLSKAFHVSLLSAVVERQGRWCSPAQSRTDAAAKYIEFAVCATCVQLDRAQLQEIALADGND